MGRAILSLGALLLSSGLVASRGIDWANTKHVIAFGDSYTYAYGLHGRYKYSFIGDYLPGNFSFTPEELLENYIYQNYTAQSAGGPNWIQHLTGCAVEEGRHYPVECEKQLWDFAFAGANTAEAILPLHWPFTVPLVNQTQQYLTWADPVLRRKTCLDPSKALVAVWIGINDINDAYKLNLTSRQLYAENIAATLTASADLYNAGYHNFLFLNLPPLDRNPGNLVRDRKTPNATEIGWWDEELRTQSAAFEAAHEDARALVFDANTLLHGVLDDPAPHGITNTTNFCSGRDQWPAVIENPAQFGCPVPVAEYFWFDSGHIGTRAHKALADGIEKALAAETRD
ncbi:hypothetical protein B0T11DRAFT_287843 [Plectosphaerella cucumerina]|uniref:Lysophospholipase A n=1 Tax=Plectosphaerella cucumerina TaxID=40658 RepID=A0A8K0T8I3_9PEZI|nr:hypothetical protein B0T11DRAFT_287843 [Plectosphaerella cucumerina]